MFLAVDYHAAPDLAVSEMHLPWHTHICGMPRLFPHCALLSFSFFILFFIFLGVWCHSRNINDGNLRASCVVLARCSRFGLLH
jgi:hypothetical protein